MTPKGLIISCLPHNLIGCFQNQKYFQGLRWAVDLLHSKGVEPRVLDIGTGTGLLGMMAVECGAKNVIACEVGLVPIPLWDGFQVVLGLQANGKDS